MLRHSVIPSFSVINPTQISFGNVENDNDDNDDNDDDDKDEQR